ncbi:MAG: ETC complex I subunit [Rhodobacteraceae bacterium]|nr:ETC complex I subunit [Paracoccaceae bacterium]MCY4196385.1 ETC complex I subunit [Paracoccaceae bacterium]MCY4326462.1 ETC complex I subunit [Paracoccaceae bacterium]
MSARIFRPSRSTTQSGSAKSKKWVLEIAPCSARKLDPLMGWTSSSDTRSQVRLTFDSRDAAIDYAKANGLAYSVMSSNRRNPVLRKRGYGENFAYERRETWTH